MISLCCFLKRSSISLRRPLRHRIANVLLIDTYDFSRSLTCIYLALLNFNLLSSSLKLLFFLPIVYTRGKDHYISSSRWFAVPGWVADRVSLIAWQRSVAQRFTINVALLQYPHLFAPSPNGGKREY